MKKIKKINYNYTSRLTKPVINEILKIEKTKGLTAKNLLNQAKNKKSQLHNLFEWDNSKAGEKWREHQARLIINEVEIFVGNKKLYAFENVNVTVSTDKEDESIKLYKPYIEILNNKNYRNQKLREALDHIRYWRQKYSELSELKPIFLSIDKVTKKIIKLQMKGGRLNKNGKTKNGKRRTILIKTRKNNN